MVNSDFCYSPLGQRHGDSDRYLPAILYGCIPVFIKEEEARPFDEVIDWSRISLSLRPVHVSKTISPACCAVLCFTLVRFALLCRPGVDFALLG